MNFLLFGKLPDLDELGRPKMFYSKTIHEQCERRAYFEAGKFVEAFGTPEMEKGYCLFKMGCKGPQTYAPCPMIRYNDNASWCIMAGAPCIGCYDMSSTRSTPSLRTYTCPGSAATQRPTRWARS
jgi:NiFe hydrogenase small subunit HydA